MMGNQRNLGLLSIGYDMLLTLSLFGISFIFTLFLGLILILFDVIGNGFAIIGSLFFLLLVPILIIISVLLNNRFFSRSVAGKKRIGYLFHKNEVDYRCIEKNSIYKFVLLKLSSVMILLLLFFIFAFLSAVILFLSKYSIIFLLIAYPIVIICVILPAVTWVMITYSFDVYEPEPRSMVVMGLLWGMFSTFPSLFLNTYNSTWMPGIGLSTAVVSAPIFEELFKIIGFIFVFKIIRNESDGIIYGAAFGAGFAMLENFLYSAYVILASDSNTALGFTLLLFFRSFFNILLHMAGPVMVGFIIGMYMRKRSDSQKGKNWFGKPMLVILIVMGYFFAFTIHASWNYLAGAQNILVLLMVPLGFFVLIFFFGMSIIGLVINTMKFKDFNKEARREDMGVECN